MSRQKDLLLKDLLLKWLLHCVESGFLLWGGGGGGGGLGADLGGGFLGSLHPLSKGVVSGAKARFPPGEERRRGGNFQF